SIKVYPYRYLAKNTEQLYSQWLYHEYSTFSMSSTSSVQIDNSEMPDVVYETDMLGNMVLAVPLDQGEHLSQVNINGKSVGSVLEEAGFGYIYLPRLARDKYAVNWEIGPTKLKNVIHNRGTYNVYDVVH